MSSNPNYHNANNTPYGSGDPYYNESTGYITPMPMKKRTSNWVKIGVPVLVVVILAAVLGGVLGTRASKKSSDSSSSAQGDTASGAAAASSAVSVKNAIGVFPTATNSLYLQPIYPSAVSLPISYTYIHLFETSFFFSFFPCSPRQTNTAAFTKPTFVPSTNAAIAWPEDPFSPASPSKTTVRTDRPRIIAPAYKWQALPNLIASDPYLKLFNDTIFGNATEYYGLSPVKYNLDGGNGILDNAREIKERVKAFAYVYRMTNNTKWVDRLWTELEVCFGRRSIFGRR